MIWFLGDDSIREVVQQFANGEEILDSASSEAVPEIVWTDQVHAARPMGWWRPNASPIKAIIYLPQREYDSELTLWHIVSRIPQESKVFYIVPPAAEKLREGLDHFDLSNVKIVEYTPGEDLLAELRAA